MIDETTVALVADASRAHLFRVEVAFGTWNPLQRYVHPEAPRHDRDLREARQVENAPHGRHKLQADRFAKHVAAELARSYDRQVFRRLIVVAPPEFIGMLRPQLPKRVAQAVIEERTQDLSSLRADELAERIPVPHE